MSTEATALLDLVEIAYRKSKHIKNSSIVFYNNNRKLIRAINYEELIENEYTQDARVEISRIR